MEKQSLVDKKLADWVSFFNSISNKQTPEAKILKSLILGYHAKPIKMEGIMIARG